MAQPLLSLQGTVNAQNALKLVSVAQQAWSLTYGVTGAIGGSATGIGTQLALGSVPSFRISAPCTLEWWVKPLVQGGDGYGTLLIDNAVFGNGFYVKDVSASTSKLSYWFNNAEVATNTTAINIGTTYHMAVSVTSAGAGTFYRNGVADGTFTWGGAFNINRCFTNDANEALRVTLLDEVAVYDTALTVTQLLAHYNAGVAGVPATYRSTVFADAPVAYWQLEETSGLTLADATGNGHAITLAGSGSSTNSGGARAFASLSGKTDASNRLCVKIVS